MTGAGAGAVFGPHVRAFDHDGAAVAAIAKVSFFAYGTLQQGVEVASGDVDRDGYAELLTGPGPGAAFPAHLRGFDYDGAILAPIATVNAVVFPGAAFGLDVATGDLDADGADEITCGAGPDPSFGSRMRSFDHDGTSLREIVPLALDPFGLGYGLRVAIGLTDL